MYVKEKTNNNDMQEYLNLKFIEHVCNKINIGLTNERCNEIRTIYCRNKLAYAIIS